MTTPSDVLLDMVAEAVLAGELEGLGLAVDAILDGISRDTGAIEDELRIDLNTRVLRKRREALMLKVLAIGLSAEAV